MKWFSSIVFAALLAMLVPTGAQAQQKGAEVQIAGNKAGDVIKMDASVPAAAPSQVTIDVSHLKAVKGKSSFLRSHIRSVGSVGLTERYEIVSVKVRGLDTPNVAGFFIYDKASDSIVGMQTAGAPGLGVAIVNGGSQVAGNFLFGSKIRPDQQNINAGARAGVSASSSSSADSVAGATGGTSNATGGAGGTGGTGNVGGKPTPPGLINNPGHSN